MEEKARNNSQEPVGGKQPERESHGAARVGCDWLIRSMPAELAERSLSTNQRPIYSSHYVMGCYSSVPGL